VEYLTIQNGLSDNTINAIIKDNTGFVWFATNNGICRYDGYTIKNYSPDNNYLFVQDMIQTKDGLIWCATTNGLFCFDPIYEKFLSNQFHSNSKRFIEGNIKSIISDDSGGLWLATSNGLCHVLNIERKDIATTPITLVTYNKRNSNIPSEILTTLIKDNNSRIWIGSWDHSLFSFNTKTNTFKQIQSFLNEQVKSASIQTLHIKDSTLWIGTIKEGIIKMNLENYTYDYIQNKESNILSHHDIYGVTHDSFGHLWIGTWNGIDRVNTKDNTLDFNTIDHYTWDHPYFNENLENRISTLYWDPTGVIWVGTFGGGVVKINIHKNIYKRYKFDSYFEVNSFMEDANGYIWTSMYHGGIKKTQEPTAEKNNFTFTSYNKSKKESGLNTDIILSIAKDSLGTLWFGSNKSSLYKYNTLKNSFTEHKITIKNNPNWNGAIRDICIDHNGDFWLASDKGLLFYQPKLSKFSLVSTSKNNALNNNEIKTIYKDSNHNIWIGTAYGLNKLTQKNDTTIAFQKFNDIDLSNTQLYNKEVWSIYEDNKQELWIGYRGGLGHLNKNTNKIKIFNTKDGLANNFVSCITEDNEHNIWIGTDSGISKFDPSNNQFENLHIANNNRSAYKDSYGNLYFGNNNGFVTFNPKNIHKDSIVPTVIISDLIINNKPVKINSKVNGQVILTESMHYTHQLTLAHPNHNFALEFNSLSFPFQEFNKYAYKLEEVQQSWKSVDARSRVVVFQDLKPGSYTFLIKASNNDGVWNETPTKLLITLVPAWWQTWYARLFFIIGFIGILGLLYYLRIQRIYVIENRKAEKLKLEHRLKVAKFEKNKETELSEMKSKFFTNLSHELRTPLTLILSPLQHIMSLDTTPDNFKKLVSPIEKNTIKLLKLVNQLLDFRKIVTNKMELRISKYDIQIFLKDIYQAFTPLAKQQNIEYIFSCKDDYQPMWFDLKNMEIVVSNLLQNAFKFTPKDGKITITLSFESKNNRTFCCIEIKDTGKGISKKDQIRLFERYYQVEKNNSQVPGSGIGLSLVKEIIDLHQGEIQVESNLNKGTSFKVIIPTCKEQYDNFIVIPPHKTTHNNLETKLLPQKKNTRKTSTNKETTILIVEDNQELLEFMNLIFQDDYNILLANNGEQAYLMLNKTLPDIIISDIMMPIMDGITLCKKLKSNPKTSYIPFILLTAKTNSSDQIEALKTGADDFITKPFDSQILKIKIESYVKTRKQLKAFFGKTITLDPSKIELKSHEETFLLDAIKIIEDNLTSNTFNVKTYASQLNMSQATLYRKIKMYTDLSIQQFIRSIKLKRAAQLILLNQFSISQVSEMVGFTDNAYFRKIFTEQFELTPSQYQKEYLKTQISNQKPINDPLLNQ